MSTKVTITWNTDDVISAAEERGMDITEEQAEVWLNRNEKYIRDRSIELGWEVLDSLMSIDPPRKSQ